MNRSPDSNYPIDISWLENDRQVDAINAAIDGGIPLNSFRDLVELSIPYLGYVKFGWASSMVTSCLAEKIKVLQKAGIPFWFGGTLFELAFTQGRLENLLDWCDDQGVEHFEISDGTIEIEETEKCRLVEKIAKRFTVFSEVGSKDVKKVMPPSEWKRKILLEIGAGASFVIAEGRESGTVGIYRSSGEIRTGLIEELKDVEIDFSKMIFEAPNKSQQVWFLENLGREVNFGNLPMTDILNVECLRLGLRGDTLNLYHQMPSERWPALKFGTTRYGK